MADAAKTMDILIRLRTEVDQALKDLKSGKKGIDDIGDSAGKASGLFGGFTDTIKQFAGAVGVGLGIQQFISFFKDSVTGASEAEAATAKLGAEVKLAGADYDAIKPAITAVKDELSQYAVRGVQVDQAVASLLARNFSLAQSLQAVTVAAKISVSEHITLEEALNDVVNATNGVIRPASLLGQLLINQRQQILAAADAGERFNIIYANLGKLDDIAASQLDTSALKIKNVGAAFKDLEEQIGSSPAGKTAVDLLTVLGSFFKGINDADKATDAAKTSASAALDLKIQEQQRALTTLQNFQQQLAAPKGVQESASAGLLGFLGFNDPNEVAKTNAEIQSLQNSIEKLTALRNLAKVNETTTANKAVTTQGDDQSDQRHNQLIDATDAFLAQQAAKEEASRAQLAEIIDQQDAAIRQKRYAAELSALGDNLQARLALTQKFYAQELSLAEDSTQKQIADRNQIIDAATARIAKLDPTADVDYIKQIAEAAANGKADITDFMGQLAIPEKQQAQFLQEFNLIVAQFGKVHEAATKLEGLQIEIPVKIKAEDDAAIKQAVTDIQDRLNKQLQDIQAQKATGSLSAQGALTSTLQARATASAQFQPILDAEQSQLNSLNAIVGPLTPEQAAARQQLIKDITDLNAQMAKLKPTTEEEIQASNSLFEGISLGAKKAAADSQSFGQIGAQVTDQFENGIAKGGVSLFDNLTSGAKNFGATAKQVFSQLLMEIANAILQALMLKAIQTGLGGFAGGGIAGGGGGAVAGGSGAPGGGAGIGDEGFGPAATGGIVNVGTGPTADDVHVMVSRGEGIVRAASVDHYGPSLIHALNRQSLPRDIFNHRPAPSHRFAEGGVVGQLANETGTYTGASLPQGRPMIVVGIGDAEIDKINSHSSSREATFSHIEQNPQRVAEALRGGPGLSIDVTTLDVFYFAGAWSGPIKLSREVVSVIDTAATADETRDALVDTPRLGMAFALESINEHAEVRAIERFLRAHIGQRIVVPLWSEAVALTESTAGEIIECESTIGRLFSTTRHAMLWTAIGDFEVFDIETVNEFQIVATANLTDGFNIGDAVIPVMITEPIAAQTALNFEDSYRVTGMIQFWEDAAEASALPFDFIFPDYAGLEIFPFSFSWAQTQPSLAFSKNVSLRRAETNVAESAGLQAIASTMLKGQVSLTCRDQIAKLMTFFDAQLGRQQRFWCPSGKRDFKVVSNGNALGQIVVENCGFTSGEWNDDPDTARIFLLIRDNTNAAWYARRITGSAVVTNGNEQLTLSSAIPHIDPQSDVSFLYLARFNFDDIEIDFDDTDHAKALVDFMELVNEGSDFIAANAANGTIDSEGVLLA